MRIGNCSRGIALFTGVLLLSSLGGHSASATPKPAVVVVGTCISLSNTILTVQAGVNAATSGATVEVCPGTYKEQVEITKPLTLTGIKSGNMDAAVITSPATGVVNNTFAYLDPAVSSIYLFPTAAQIWVHDTTDVTITNLTVDGSNNNSPSNCSALLLGIYFENASGTVENAATRNQITPPGCGDGIGMWVETAPGRTAKVSFEENSLESFDGGAINARGAGTKAEIEANSVVGLGSIGTPLNEVSIAHGATGTIKDNSVIDALLTGNLPDDLNNASCGITTGTVQDVTISGNTVGNTQCGIGLYNSQDVTVVGNNVFGTRVNDGIYVCGNKNDIEDNRILGSDQAGVHLSCGEFIPTATANNNTVKGNTINGACAGILLRPGTIGNIVNDNKFFNVLNVSKTANTCP